MTEGSIFQKSVMKGMMKGKILKKLKSIKQVGYLKPDRILQVRAAEGFADSIQKISNFVTKKIDQDLSLRFEKPKQSGCDDDADAIQEEGEEDGDGMEAEEDKENMRPLERISDKDSIFGSTLGEIDVSTFRRPDLDSGSLFDPKLLEAFEEVKRVQRLISIGAEQKLLTEAARIVEKEEEEQEDEPPLKVQKLEHDPLAEFELRCPLGGSDAIILYTTTLRGIRKTFEDCQSIRFLLQTFKVQFFERDVSMHAEYRTEMCDVLGNEMALPPRLFVKGRYVGGAEEVLRLHEQGKFRVLLEGIGVDEGNGMCDGCGGMRFVLCFRCSGSRRVDLDGVWEKCGVCNENGLIVCPYCC